MSRMLRFSAEGGKSTVEPEPVIHNLHKRGHIIIKRTKASAVLMDTWDM